MANGTVLRPPSIVALYTMADGRFNLNLFVKNGDGTIASESTVGRYTFSMDKYCEWIVYTIRNNLDKPGVTKGCRSVSGPRVSPPRSEVNLWIIGRRSDSRDGRKA